MFRKHGRKTSIVLSLVVLLTIVSAVNCWAADYVIRSALGHAPESSWVKAQEKFKEYLEELSDGRITVEVYHSGQLGTTREIVEMVNLNSLEIAAPGSAQVQAYVPEMGLTVLPFLWKTSEGMFDAYDSWFGDYLEDKLNAQNFHCLGWYRNGFRSVTNNRKPINTVEDLEGLKIRVLPSPNVMAFFKAVGANPVHVDWVELYESLRMGVVEAQENPPFFVHFGKMHEVQKYYSFTRHMNEPGIVVMSKQFYDSLPEDLQVAVDTAARKAELWQRDKMNQDNQERLQMIKEAGVEINEVPEETMEEFRKITYEQVFPKVKEEEMCGPYTEELIDMIIWYQK